MGGFEEQLTLMTRQQWNTLQAGSIIKTKAGTLRKVLKISKIHSNVCITLDKVKGEGITVYVVGDKYLFDKLPLRLKEQLN